MAHAPSCRKKTRFRPSNTHDRRFPKSWRKSHQQRVPCRKRSRFLALAALAFDSERFPPQTAVASPHSGHPCRISVRVSDRCRRKVRACCQRSDLIWRFVSNATTILTVCERFGAAFLFLQNLHKVRKLHFE